MTVSGGSPGGQNRWRQSAPAKGQGGEPWPMRGVDLADCSLVRGERTKRLHRAQKRTLFQHDPRAAFRPLRKSRPSTFGKQKSSVPVPRRVIGTPIQLQIPAPNSFHLAVLYGLLNKMEQSTGPENIGHSGSSRIGRARSQRKVAEGMGFEH
jgi:hypothetical protein